MSLRPTEIALEKTGSKGFYVAIDDPDTVGVLLIPCSFEHRRVVSRAELENGFELHPARCSEPVPPSPREAGEGQVEKLKRLVDRQAKDEALWFAARNASTAYIQQELRKLHQAIEVATELSASTQPTSAPPVEEGGDCEHEWADPPQAVVDAQGNRKSMCLKCSRYEVVPSPRPVVYVREQHGSVTELFATVEEAMDGPWEFMDDQAGDPWQGEEFDSESGLCTQWIAMPKGEGRVRITEMAMPSGTTKQAVASDFAGPQCSGCGRFAANCACASTQPVLPAPASPQDASEGEGP
jgi:hypothetical protein